MQPSEIRATGALAGDAAAGIGGLARDLHRAIAARAFGPASSPARVVHDRIADGVYAGIDHGLRGLGRAGGEVMARRSRADAPALGDTPGGARALAALNGWMGDRLHEGGSPLALGLRLRVDGEPTGRVAVFVHGLVETDDAWRVHPFKGAGSARPTYGERLRADAGFTAVYVRYNTGRKIRSNGEQLAAALDHLLASWPVPLERVDLVGHSMGGLVARCAAHVGERDDHAWTTRLRTVVGLGAPHLGADREKGAHLAARALGITPESKVVQGLFDARSSGIRDLKDGWLAEVEGEELPFCEHASYCYVSATLAGPLGHLAGDLLVRAPSASGTSRTRSIGFEAEDGLHLQGASHFDLLNHPAVYEQLRRWLSVERPALPPAPAR